MRSPRLLTFALVRDPRLPHLLRGLLGDLWRATPQLRRRLVIAACYEELGGVERGDEIEAVLVEVQDSHDMQRVSGARDAAPGARVVAVPSSLLLTPEALYCEHGPALKGLGARLLRSLDEAGLRDAIANHSSDRRAV